MKEFLREEKTSKRIEIDLGEERNDDWSMANAFNNFFIDKVKNLHQKLQEDEDVKPRRRTPQGVTDKFSFEPITRKEINTIISGMKSSQSFGTDKLSSKLVKEFRTELVSLIQVMVNRVLASGIFPSILTSSIISPIYKGAGNKREIKSYRPVSNLPIIGKIIESAMEKQLRRYFENHNLLGDNQFGYRKNRSRISALINIITKIKKEEDNNQAVALLQLDLSSAFDMMSKKLLIKQLESYGFTPLAINLIDTYLSGRTQQVRLEEQLSDKRENTYGSPQGSCISPLLFAVYLGDISYYTNESLTTYADDTVMILSGSDKNELKTKLEMEDKEIVKYLAMRKMVANPAKFNLLVVNGKVDEERLELNIGECKIEEREATKLLGVELNNRLRWSEDMENTIKELKYRNHRLRQMQRYFDTKTLKIFGHGLIMSKLCSNLPAYGYRFLRLEESDPKNGLINTMFNSIYN